MNEEQRNQGNRTHAVECTCRFETTEKIRQQCCPFHIREFQRHPRQRQREETQQHNKVHNSLTQGETPVKPLRSFLFVRQPVFPRTPETPQPRKGVQDGEGQYGHKQYCHEPERVKEERIFLWIVVRGMSEVASEFPMCARVTLRTSLYNIASAQPRVGIVGGEDIMGTMTVIAFGRSLGPEATDLAVVGIKECLRFFSMTSTTLSHHSQSEALHISTRNGVGCVAILAGRQFFLCIHVSRPVDTCLEDLLNAMMAAAARCSDVGGINRRGGIIRRQFPMSGMTVGTGSARGCL